MSPTERAEQAARLLYSDLGFEHLEDKTHKALVSRIRDAIQAQSNEDLERHRDRVAVIQMKLDAALTRERRLLEKESRVSSGDSSNSLSEHRVVEGMTTLMEIIRRDNERWWIDIHTGAPLNRNVGEMLALVHSEISEALEGHRKNLPDDHLPHRPMFEVELADAIIRLLDIAAHLCPTMPITLMEKLAYNRIREDHKTENRLKEGGKKY